jgi:hypothetical protein
MEGGKRLARKGLMAEKTKKKGEEERTGFVFVVGLA